MCFRVKVFTVYDFFWAAFVYVRFRLITLIRLRDSLRFKIATGYK